jgi:hypothetical protein
MHQYCVYTNNNLYIEVGQWLMHNDITHEIHMNRIRFWIPEGPALTEFLLKYANICPSVEERLDNDYSLS